MKHFIKRVSALALACVLVIAMGCPAFSANKEDSIALDKSDVEMKEFLTTRGFTEDYLDALMTVTYGTSICRKRSPLPVCLSALFLPLPERAANRPVLP